MRLASDTPRRKLLLSPEIYELISGPYDNKDMARRCARIAADLETFVKGNLVSICMEPFRAKTAYLAKLSDPDVDVWEIRCQDPRPGFRIIGHFAKRDVFVALKAAPRSKMVPWHPEPPLDAASSPEWKSIIDRSKLEWMSHFPGNSPLTGVNINDYVSTNAIAS